MEQNHARAFTYEALTQLKAALDSAKTPADFLVEADAIIARSENVLQLPTSLGAPDPLDAKPSAGSGRDADNAPRVYEYLGAFDRANASDRRLWTYLAFSTYRGYMEIRWPLDGVRNWQSRVQDRWLMLNVTRGRLVRHGIARLWWVAALTYDARRQHPLSTARSDAFAYTREAFRNEDRINAIFDREAGAIPGLVRSILEHAAQGDVQATDKHLQAIMKELTLMQGYRELGSLSQEDLDSLVAGSAPVRG